LRTVKHREHKRFKCSLIRLTSLLELPVECQKECMSCAACTSWIASEATANALATTPKVASAIGYATRSGMTNPGRTSPCLCRTTDNSRYRMNSSAQGCGLALARTQPRTSRSCQMLIGRSSRQATGDSHIRAGDAFCKAGATHFRKLLLLLNTAIFRSCIHSLTAADCGAAIASSRKHASELVGVLLMWRVGHGYVLRELSELLP
jgi:hypothetical protein